MTNPRTSVRFRAGTSGSGTDNYSDIGTFSLGVVSTCTWSISITSRSPSPHLQVPEPDAAAKPDSDAGTGARTDADAESHSGGNGPARVLAGRIRRWDLLVRLRPVPRVNRCHALQRPVVGITPTVDDGGYWLVASDGGIFAFGDAGFYNSIPESVSPPQALPIPSD